MQVRQYKLYLLVLVLMLIVVVVALGGGLFRQQQPWVIQWQHRMFASLCHQMPSRSFWINGQPMAVCSRCFGIYTGFLAGWILLPLIALVEVNRSYASGKLLLCVFFINLIDVIGNLLGLWQNTLVSRWVLGWLLGLAAAALFSGAFFIKRTIQKKKHYGKITNRALQ